MTTRSVYVNVYDLLAFNVESEFVVGVSGEDSAVDLVSLRFSEVFGQLRIAGDLCIVFAQFSNPGHHDASVEVVRHLTSDTDRFALFHLR